jgi:hypothetical protein
MANKPFAESWERIYRYLTTGSTALATTELTRKGVIESASLIAEDSVLAASTTKPGLVELAIGSEVTTGTDATRAVTPKALADAGIVGHGDEATASETVAGIVELATTQEATTGTDTARAVTPAGVAAYCPSASESAAGKVELATTQEASTGTDTARAVTPAGLAAYCPAASDTVVGKVELATNLETRAVTSQALAVTPYGLGHALVAGFELMSFTGKNNTGACTATGLKINDIVVSLVGLTDMGDASASFEAVITANDQIQQSSASDLSLKNYLAIIYRAVAPV